MTRSISSLLLIASSLSLAACIPDYEYEGDYAMTYALVTSPSASTSPDGEVQPIATAGTTRIAIRKGLVDDQYLVDLGPSFCQVTAKLVPQVTIEDVPYLEIAPQPCWHDDAALSISGNASWDDDAEHLTIVLAGSTFSKTGRPVGATTVQFTETW